MITNGKMLLENEDFINEIKLGLTTTKHQKNNGRIHASTAGYCPKRGALEAVYDGNKEYSAASKLYMGIGIKLEDEILEALNKQKKLFYSQYNIPDIGINLGGRVDGVILYNNKLHVLEIKSCGKLPDKANPEHVSQLMIYSAVTGLPALLLYASRSVADYNGDLHMKMFDFAFDKQYASDCLANAAVSFFASKNNLLPEIPKYIKSKSKCGFCPFTNICWDNEPQTYLEPMSNFESEQIENAVEDFINKNMKISEIKKRRNGVLKYLSLHGNKTAKFYLDNEEWNSLLIDF